MLSQRVEQLQDQRAEDQLVEFNKRLGDIKTNQENLKEDCGKDDLAFYDKLSNVLIVANVFLVLSAVLIFVLTKRQIRKLL